MREIDTQAVYEAVAAPIMPEDYAGLYHAHKAAEGFGYVEILHEQDDCVIVLSQHQPINSGAEYRSVGVTSRGDFWLLQPGDPFYREPVPVDNL